MKVLHVVAYFPPERMGGVGEVVAHLHRGLLAEGHESRVLTTGRGGDDPRVERIAAHPLVFAARLAGCADRAADADVVHCHHGDALGLLLALRLRRVRTPVLVTYHVGHRGMGRAFRPYALDGLRVGTGWRGFAYRALLSRLHRLTDRLCLGLADAASFVSESAARDVLGAGAAGANVIHIAVPPPVCAPAPGAQTPDPTELLYVGADGHRKRVLALPLVLEAVRRSHPDARLRLVGIDLERSPALRALFRERCPPEAVVCEGALPSHQVERFYPASRLLLLPSAYEGLPMVILEAMRAGLPCVATRVSGHPEAIEDGRTGRLVAPDAPAEMALACAELLADESRRARMAAAARARVAERFGLERQRERYLALYRELGRGR